MYRHIVAGTMWFIRMNNCKRDQPIHAHIQQYPFIGALAN
ncbi:hypothetical protein HMPREF3190_00656 [Umbribacter vaginalis]|nr:hypothetical protein HMPREF3190_00656 [Coriobacteriales bacterium DNF00809]